MATKESTAQGVSKEVKIKKDNKKDNKVSCNFTIDCSKPVEDKVFNTKNFTEYLQQKIKINGKTGKLGESVRVSSDDKKITVKTDIVFSKRYLKYLTKKYLKRHSLR